MRRWLLAVVLLVGLSFMGCENEELYKRWPEGTLIKMKVDGRRGIIKGYEGWYLIVRMGTVEMRTRTHTLSNDDPVQMFPYSDIRVREYEIERWRE